MALTTTQVTQICDSVAKGIDDYTTAFITNTNTNAPLYTTIVNSTSGTNTTNTVGRVLNFLDNVSEQILLSKVNNLASNVTAYIASVRTISNYNLNLYSFFDALDSVLGGLNAYLTSNSLQVKACFANAFNAYVTNAIGLGYRNSSNAPTSIATANFFPDAAIDTMWGFTANGATTFSANAVGSNTNTTGFGGGVAQFYIYKNNAGNAAGGAAFTVGYTNGAGSAATATYNTSSGTPTASGSLASGFTITGAIGSAITSITGTGMTSGEQYTIGQKLIRASAY
jgi:hypothetical protein